MSLPDQEIYETVSDKLIDNGMTWFSTLPDIKETFTKMPYVYCGDVSLQLLPNKSSLQGTVSITLNLFGRKEQRWQLSELQQQMYRLLLPIDHTASYRVVIDPVVTVNTVTEENIDNATIWHGTLDLTYKIY